MEQISEITYSSNSKVHSVSRNTIYKAIDEGNIPGVTRESLNKTTTNMFSNGLLRVPDWAKDQQGFCDGDVFELDISIANQVTFRKVIR